MSRTAPRSRNAKVGIAAGFTMLMVALVGGYEGLRLTSYPDIIGVWTVCYGETKNVRRGQTFSKSQCDAQLVQSLIEHENGMLRCLTRPLPDPVHGAFLSLTYNIGVGAFCKSSVARAANENNLKLACANIKKFNMGGGRVIYGLTKRRADEFKLCMQGAA